MAVTITPTTITATIAIAATTATNGYHLMEYA